MLTEQGNAVEVRVGVILHTRAPEAGHSTYLATLKGLRSVMCLASQWDTHVLARDHTDEPCSVQGSMDIRGTEDSA